MTTQLKVIGREHIGKIEFTGIEGGFGKDKKAMLVKDIAKIHGRSVCEINEVINKNIKRFKNGIDLLDLKQIVQADLFSDYGFTKAQWGNAKHIYLLSERGYAKLLKILDDDKAWDIYDELVDNYFNMRVAIKNNEPSLVQQRRLSIMEDNAATRKASIMYKIAMATDSKTSSQRLLSLKGSDHMDFLKMAFYTACGCFMSICYYTGHPILMNWVFIIWLPVAVWDFVKTITPYQKTQKKD